MGAPPPLLLSLLLLAPLPALANGPDCGGDAYSSATIGPNRPGPLTAVPETLCADLAQQQGQSSGTRIEIIAPGLSPGLPRSDPYGDRLGPTPYDGRPPLAPRMRGGRDPGR
ncbi:hypothetical protein [Methylobacterium nonmethylotrophicum]|uniref:Uncharacterized protein n=1 Tax=Methylobacterium nonmethylotrophicum TaxID=1141884 RepID=A0A4Z0NHY9_9HYPH|nr:hypothetical protein [Methylobacterium nonmethylotrophicum]TGD95412.1 hypothetical protein EU555_27880 [Methylobacterium nonmethylotrophicum]